MEGQKPVKKKNTGGDRGANRYGAEYPEQKRMKKTAEERSQYQRKRGTRENKGGQKTGGMPTQKGCMGEAARRDLEGRGQKRHGQRRRPKNQRTRE